MRQPFEIEERNGRKFIRMGVAESREMVRRIVYREILDEDGFKARDATAWEQISFILRRSQAGMPEFHERWMAFLKTPPWVHYMRAEFLDDWLYFPIKDSDLKPSKIGKRVGEWFGKFAASMNRIGRDPSFADEIVAAGLETVDDDIEDVFGDDFADALRSNTGRMIRDRSAIVGRIMRVASRTPVGESSEFFAGFSNGVKSGRKLVEQSRVEIDQERRFIAELLTSEWERVMRMASRSEVRDYVETNLPARMRRSIVKSEDGRQSFHDRILSICKQSGLRLAGRGKPRKLEKLDSEKFPISD